MHTNCMWLSQTPRTRLYPNSKAWPVPGNSLVWLFIHYRRAVQSSCWVHNELSWLHLWCKKVGGEGQRTTWQHSCPLLRRIYTNIIFSWQRPPYFNCTNFSLVTTESWNGTSKYGISLVPRPFWVRGYSASMAYAPDPLVMQYIRCCGVEGVACETNLD